MPNTKTLPGCRHELKFIVGAGVALALAEQLAQLCVRDPFAAACGGEYLVRSVYFDSPQLASYRDKLAGVSQRARFRLRGYGDEREQAFLELKSRHGALVSKQRVALGWSLAQRLLVEPRTLAIDGELGRRFLADLRRHSLRPVLRVDYQRSAFLTGSGERVRITLDRNPLVVDSTALQDDVAASRRLLPPGHAILELKYARAQPAWFATLARHLGLERVSCSKYCLAVQALARRPS